MGQMPLRCHTPSLQRKPFNDILTTTINNTQYNMELSAFSVYWLYCLCTKVLPIMLGVGSTTCSPANEALVQRWFLMSIILWRLYKSLSCKCGLQSLCLYSVYYFYWSSRRGTGESLLCIASFPYLDSCTYSLSGWM